jgi:hypothetical protein
MPFSFFHDGLSYGVLHHPTYLDTLRTLVRKKLDVAAVQSCLARKFLILFSVVIAAMPNRDQ